MTFLCLKCILNLRSDTAFYKIFLFNILKNATTLLNTARRTAYRYGKLLISKEPNTVKKWFFEQLRDSSTKSMKEERKNGKQKS